MFNYFHCSYFICVTKLSITTSTQPSYCYYMSRLVWLKKCAEMLPQVPVGDYTRRIHTRRKGVYHPIHSKQSSCGLLPEGGRANFGDLCLFECRNALC